MTASGDAPRDLPSVVLGPLGHRINRLLGTARLALDVAGQEARASDRAASLVDPLADAVDCIDEAGRVTRALQRLVPSDRDPPELVDWCRLVESALATLPPGCTVDVRAAERPLLVRCPSQAMRALLALLLRSLVAEDGHVSVDVGRTATHTRSTVRADGPAWSAAERARRLDPFTPGGAVTRVEDLGLFVAHSELQRLGGRVEWDDGAGRNGLTLELPLAHD